MGVVVIRAASRFQPLRVSVRIKQQVQMDGGNSLDKSLAKVIWPVWLRFIVAAWFAARAAQALLTFHDSATGAAFVGVAAALFVLPSLIIAVGLLTRQVWAYWLAIAMDGTWTAFALGVVLGSMRAELLYGVTQPDWLYTIGLTVMCAGLLIEGGYLIKKLGYRWRGLCAYVPAVICFAAIGWQLGRFFGAD